MTVTVWARANRKVRPRFRVTQFMPWPHFLFGNRCPSPQSSLPSDLIRGWGDRLFRNMLHLAVCRPHGTEATSPGVPIQPRANHRPIIRRPMARTDAIVLGAGIVGTSIALHLARRGLAVTLLDRR